MTLDDLLPIEYVSGELMRENLSRDVLRAAYTEASLELRTLLGDF